jgi:hypothetical protein
MAKTPPKLLSVSFTADGRRQGNHASSSPSVSQAGSPVLFQSDADNLTALPAPDRNCVGDVLFWNISNRRLAIESAASDGRVSGNPNNPNADPCPAQVTSPATAPASSYSANYVAFEDANPLLDLAVADRSFPGLRGHPDTAAAMATGDPKLHQVYVHFVGQ